MNEDLRELLVLFADGRVEFLIVGAYALAYHGAPPASGDSDLFVRASAENADRVFQALLRFGAPLLAHGVSAGDFPARGCL